MKKAILNIKPSPISLWPKLDTCRCGSCKTEMPVDSALQDYGNHDGWELPAYTIHLCPLCDGDIDDYWPSWESHFKWRTETELTPEEFKRMYFGDWEIECK